MLHIFCTITLLQFNVEENLGLSSSQLLLTCIKATPSDCSTYPLTPASFLSPPRGPSALHLASCHAQHSQGPNGKINPVGNYFLENIT